MKIFNLKIVISVFMLVLASSVPSKTDPPQRTIRNRSIGLECLPHRYNTRWARRAHWPGRQKKDSPRGLSQWPVMWAWGLAQSGARPARPA